MSSTRKRQICFTIEEDVVKEMKKVRERTGIPVAKQIEMKLKGYRIVKEE
jgi:hypothetical protein